MSSNNLQIITEEVLTDDFKGQDGLKMESNNQLWVIANLDLKASPSKANQEKNMQLFDSAKNARKTNK